MAACCVKACRREATERVDVELALGFGCVLCLPLLACAADARRMATGGRFRWSARSQELFSAPGVPELADELPAVAGDVP